MRFVLRILGLAGATPAERRATFWTAAMFFCALASSFVLRPLRDQFGVAQGSAAMPRLYGITLAVTVLFVPLFWWLCDRLPSRRFVPIAWRALAVSMAAVFVALSSVGSYDWGTEQARWIGEGFWGFFSAFNVATPALVWIHAVERFTRPQGLRLFGLVGVGGTAGAVAGSWLAGLVPALDLRPASAALASLLLLELGRLCYLASAKACDRMQAEAGEPSTGARVSRGGLLVGLSLLRQQGRLRAIAGYMALLGMVAAAFAYARTELVGAQIGSAREQHGFLAHTEALSQGLVLSLQLFFTGRLLRRLPARVFLTMSPLLSALGLCAIWLWPSVWTVALVLISLRGVQFALEKPSREALYTPLDLETKHPVKFLLDTVALRGGDWLGACLQVGLAQGIALGKAGVFALSATLCGLWALLGWRLGRAADPQPAD